MKKQHNIAFHDKILAISITILTLLVGACTPNATTETPPVQIIEVKLKPIGSPLYFNAFVKPRREVKITAPVDGIIDAIHFGYGESIAKDYVLLAVTSESLGKEYHDKLFKYLKAKQELQTHRTAWDNTQELDSYGLIAKNETIAAKNKLADSTLANAQAKQDLQSVLDTLDINDFDFDQLDIQNTEDVVKRLSEKLNKIQIKASTDGIALLPDNAGKSQHKLTPGTPIRKNEVLLSLGDMSGVQFDIQVNETQIEHIQPGAPVLITFTANPKIRLRGKVEHIDTQALTQNNDNPRFAVQVGVPTLSQAQQHFILVGMSAKLRIEPRQKRALMVPIDAVYQKEGKHYVNVVQNDTPNTHTDTDTPTARPQSTPVQVKTGPTNMNEVAILKGLKPGSRIEVRRHT